MKALRQALARLQYEIKPNFQVVDTWGRTLHICHSPVQEWDLSVREQLHDLARYMTRSDMQCIDRGFDVVGTLKALQKFSWADQCLLRQLMTGAVTPADVLHRQNEQNCKKCSHCGEVKEDLWHRWWECPAWTSARKAHPRAWARRHPDRDGV